MLLTRIEVKKDNRWTGYLNSPENTIMEEVFSVSDREDWLDWHDTLIEIPSLELGTYQFFYTYQGVEATNLDTLIEWFREADPEAQKWRVITCWMEDRPIPAYHDEFQVAFHASPE